MKTIKLIKTAYGALKATLPSGEIVTITPKAFGSNKFRVQGDGMVGQSLFTKQFYGTLKEAKSAVINTYNKMMA